MPNLIKPNLSFWLVLFLLVFISGLILHRAFAFGIRQQEGFNQKNPKITYTPQKPDGNMTPSIQFTVNDFLREAIEVPDCLKIYKRLQKPKAKDEMYKRAEDEYSNPPNTLEIYKKYTSGMVDKEREMLDKHFGSLFTKEVLSTNQLNDFLDKVEQTMLQENKLHGFIKYTCIYPLREYPFTEFSDYFGKLIYQYKGRETQLAEIKAGMYKVLWPIYLHSKFIEHFKTNQTIYDKKDDAMYVLNTTRDTLKKLNFDELQHRENERNLYIIKNDPTNVSNQSLTLESITLLTISTILYNIYTLTLPGVCQHLTIPRAELRKVFLDYLELKFPKNKAESIVAFLLDVNNDPAFPE